MSDIPWRCEYEASNETDWPERVEAKALELIRYEDEKLAERNRKGKDSP